MSPLKIQEIFSVHGRGFFLIPALPALTTGAFKPFDSQVVVRKPDGAEREFDAKFQAEHFYAVSGGEWRVIVRLANSSKADFPEGSEVMVDQDVLALLKHATVYMTN